MDATKRLALLEHIESSSSSDEDELLVLEYLTSEEKPKVTGFIVNVVHKYSDDEFKKNFRLTRTSCDHIINGFQNSTFCPTEKSHGGKEPVSAETHILIFIWFAGNKCCMRDVSSRFGIAESTCHVIINRVMDYLADIAPTGIKFPVSREGKENLANDFERISGFPNVIGCIDGTYIPIRTPAKKIKSTYVNRHDQPSITLQGICDANRKFLDVFTGTSSKIHDARVFKLSFIYDSLQELCNGGTWHLLGDAAYPLREWLLTPYRDYGTLTNAQKKYNYKLSATRVLIENSFGILKNRFRQLMRTDFLCVDTTTKFIVSCCVRHNMCIEKDDLWDEVDNDDYDEGSEMDMNVVEAREVRETALRMLGEEKRAAICARL